MRWAILLGALLAGLLHVTLVSKYDVWWHMATGRWAIEHGAIPRTDPFSFTLRGEPWRSSNWLGGVLLYGLHAWGGVPALSLAKGAIVAASFGLLGLAARVAGVRRPSALLVTIVVTGFLVQSRYSIVRPHLFGTLLLCVTVMLLARWWARGGRGIWGVPLVVVPWTFTHGTVLLAPLLVGVVAAAHTALRREAPPRWRPWQVLAACLLALFASPDGREIVALAVDIDPGHAAMQMTEEWQRLGLEHRFAWTPLALSLAAFAAGLRAPKGRLHLLGFTLVGWYVAYRHVRGVYVLALLQVPLLALAVDDLLARLERGGLGLARRFAPALLLFGLPIVHLGLMPSKFLWSHNYLNLRFGVGLDPRAYPVETFEVLRRLPPGRTIHDLHYGGYLIYHRIPEGVFVDGRTVALYDSDFLRENLLRAAGSIDGFESVATRWSAGYALVDYRRSMNLQAAGAGWVPVAFGRTSILYADPTRAASLREAGIPLYPGLRAAAVDGASPLLRDYYSRVGATEAGRRGVRGALEAARARFGDSEPLEQVSALIEALWSEAPTKR